MVNKSRFTPQGKVDVVLLGLKAPSTVSEICRKHNIAPITYSRWKRQFINGGMDALKPNHKSSASELEKENGKLKLIIGELYVELEYLKKNLGMVN
jgi:transposase-like protein